MTVLENMGKNAKEAARFLLTAGNLKNKGLTAIADALIENADRIVEANNIDIKAARENGTRESLIDRLTLTRSRIEGMADGVRQVAALPDPTGVVIGGSTLPNGLKIEKVKVPMGVIGIIYYLQHISHCDFFTVMTDQVNLIFIIRIIFQNHAECEFIL